MNTSTAYAIARAVENKLGMHICLEVTPRIFQWSRDDIALAVMRDTNSDPKFIARKALEWFTPPPTKKTKRTDDDA